MEKFDLNLYPAVAVLWRGREDDDAEAEDRTAAARPDPMRSSGIKPDPISCRFLAHAADKDGVASVEGPEPY
jgi:hypothetical protein